MALICTPVSTGFHRQANYSVAILYWNSNFLSWQNFQTHPTKFWPNRRGHNSHWLHGMTFVFTGGLNCVLYIQCMCWKYSDLPDRKIVFLTNFRSVQLLLKVISVHILVFAAIKSMLYIRPHFVLCTIACKHRRNSMRDFASASKNPSQGPLACRENAWSASSFWKLPRWGWVTEWAWHCLFPSLPPFFGMPCTLGSDDREVLCSPECENWSCSLGTCKRDRCSFPSSGEHSQGLGLI